VTPTISNLLKAIAHRHGVVRLNEAGQAVYSGPRLEASLQWHLYEVREELAAAVAEVDRQAALEDLKMHVPVETRPLHTLRPGDQIKLLGGDPCVVESLEPAGDYGRLILHLTVHAQPYAVWLWKWSNIEIYPAAVSGAGPASALERQDHASTDAEHNL
jgi:hypothetical protein